MNFIGLFQYQELETMATLHDLVWGNIEQHKNNKAVIFDDGKSATSLTYQQLQSVALKVCGESSTANLLKIKSVFCILHSILEIFSN